MDDSCLFVKILQRLGNLGNDMPRKIFTEVGKTHDLMEQLATRAELKDDVVVLFGLGKVDQFDDVGVIQLSHNLDFFKDICSLQIAGVSEALKEKRIFAGINVTEPSIGNKREMRTSTVFGALKSGWSTLSPYTRVGKVLISIRAMGEQIEAG